MHIDIMVYDSSLKFTNQQRPTVKVQYIFRNDGYMPDDKLVQNAADGQIATVYMSLKYQQVL